MLQGEHASQLPQTAYPFVYVVQGVSKALLLVLELLETVSHHRKLLNGFRRVLELRLEDGCMHSNKGVGGWMDG